MATKEKIIEDISKKHGFPKRTVERILDLIFESIKEVTQEEQVSIKNFGVFEIKERKERRYKDFASDEYKTSEATKKLTFKMSRNYFKEVPNGDSGREDS